MKYDVILKELQWDIRCTF